MFTIAICFKPGPRLNCTIISAVENLAPHFEHALLLLVYLLFVLVSSVLRHESSAPQFGQFICQKNANFVQ